MSVSRERAFRSNIFYLHKLFFESILLIYKQDMKVMITLIRKNQIISLEYMNIEVDRENEPQRHSILVYAASYLLSAIWDTRLSRESLGA